MRAALVTRFGPVSGIDVAEVPDLTPGEGEVVIEVAAASINFPDILVVEGSYQNLPEPPFSPGKEAAGRVVAVGRDVDRVEVGDRVLALVEHGGYAEQVAVAEPLVMQLPDELTYEEAAAAGLVYLTAHFALRRRAQLQEGETVLVTGAGGGVGAATVQLAKVWGGRVLALVHSRERAQLVSKLGADVVLTSEAETLRRDVRAASGGQGANVVVEMLGGDYLSEAIRATAWEGRVVVVGFASGGQNPIKPGHLLVKNIGLLGLQSSDYRDRSPEQMRSAMAEVFDLMARDAVSPAIDRTFPLEEVADALEYVQQAKVSGKVVLTTGLS